MEFIVAWSLSAIAPAVEQVAPATSLDMQTAWIAAGASLAGALIGALIPTLMTFFQNKGSRENERGFLAVQVSSALYTYASGCVDVMYDQGEPDNQGQLCIVAKAPRLDLASLNVNWRSIPVDLLDRVFAIPNAQRVVSERLSWEAQNDFEYPILERQIAYGHLARTALTAAIDLRESAHLQPMQNGAIDLMSHLNKHLPALELKAAEIEQRRQENAW